VSEGLSRSDVLLELQEQERDLEAFTEAFRLIEGRCFEAEGSRFHPILDWQGADAALFVLGTCKQKITGIVAEYQDMLRRMDAGEIPNTDVSHRMRLIHGDD
jgi:hypothetical protein